MIFQYNTIQYNTIYNLVGQVMWSQSGEMWRDVFGNTENEVSVTQQKLKKATGDKLSEID